MGTHTITTRTIVTLIAAYLGLFVGLVDANAVSLALPVIRDDLGGGISSGPAVSAVLVYRLATYWLPVLPGWYSWRLLQRRDYL